MTISIEKVIKNIAKNIVKDLNPNTFGHGAFGADDNRIQGRLDDLSLVAKMSKNKKVIKQVKQIEHEFLNDDLNTLAKMLKNMKF